MQFIAQGFGGGRVHIQQHAIQVVETNEPQTLLHHLAVQLKVRALRYPRLFEFEIFLVHSGLRNTTSLRKSQTKNYFLLPRLCLADKV